MIIKKRKNMFVATQGGLSVVVIAPIRKQAFEITTYLMGASHANNSEQKWQRKRFFTKR